MEKSVDMTSVVLLCRSADWLVLFFPGCQLLVYPGAFNMTTGPAHWELLQRGRWGFRSFSSKNIKDVSVDTQYFKVHNSFIHMVHPRKTAKQC